MSIVKDIINEVILPLKLLIPQPLIRKIPRLTSNEDTRINKALRYMRGKCLDIGCGTNRLIREYRTKGGNGIGIDVYPWKNVDMVVKDSSKLPFEDNSFDCITFVACLNHIPNRIDVLKESYRVLKNDGIVIITNLTPFISKIWHSVIYWDEDLNKRGMKEGEVFGFTHRELLALVGEAKFRVIKRRKFSWASNSLYICKKKLNDKNT